MKKYWKIILGIGMLFLLICVCIIAFFLHQKRQNMTVNEMLQNYVEDYNVVEQLEDGNTIITVRAPDFSQIILKMSNEVDYQSISLTDLINAVKENPELVKEYIISVENLDEENVEKAFSSQIAYELLIQAIEQSEEGEE